MILVGLVCSLRFVFVLRLRIDLCLLYVLLAFDLLG